jgi:glyoxylase-like metal-dependent hydrolase (beta-lactamase superfamily II)/rhodanese-related sulfurtransferase
MMPRMIFEQVRSGGCLSYLIGCEETRAALIVDPELDRRDHYLALAAERGLRIRYVIDTHTHADHFSATRELGQSLGVPRVMHRASDAAFVDMHVEDGELIALGKLRIAVIYTPGHTKDSVCLVVGERVLTGDTLLIGGTGRTDLPTGDPDLLWHSLFERLLTLPEATAVYPAHDYKQRVYSTIGAEKADNPRLAKRDHDAFVAQMRALDLAMPTHLTEALRTNRTGGKSVRQLIGEASAQVSFMALDELRRRIESGRRELVVLDVREREAFEAGHIPGARHVPRGQLELRIDRELPDPTVRVVVCCQLGIVSTLAAATLRQMGFLGAVALDGGLEAWSKAAYPLERGSA